MSSNDVSKQLEEWRQKYYKSLSSIEKQQRYEDLLQRSLSRLALAAQGLDPNLDKPLKSLRKVLRSSADQKEIQYLLDQMEKAIARMEVNKKQGDDKTPAEVLVELLSSLKLKKDVKNEAKALVKKLKTASNSQVSKLMPELLQLLNSCIPSNAKNHVILTLVYLVLAKLKTKTQLKVLQLH